MLEKTAMSEQDLFYKPRMRVCVMDLTTADYQNMMDFINGSLIDNRQIQPLFSELFQLHHSLFWLADTECNMHNLQFYSANKQVTLDYQDIHHQNDVMHPKNHLRNLGIPHQSVYRLRELVTPQELSHLPYYQFIEHHDIIDQMVIYLSTPTGIYAGVGFIRFKGERLFTSSDKAILTMLSTHMQHLVLNAMPTVQGLRTPRQIGSGTPPDMLLSNRELQIYRLLVKGYANADIAEQLFITVNTVKKHLRNMYEKAEVNSRTSLIYKLGV